MIAAMTQTAPRLVEVNGYAVRALRTATTAHTVRSLAAAVGLTYGHLAKIERGEVRRVRPDTLAALAAALGVEVRALLSNPYGGSSPAADAA